MSASIFIKNIKYLNYKNDWNLTELAKNSGIDKSTLTKLLQEERIPSKTTLNKIANALDIEESILINTLLDQNNREHATSRVTINNEPDSYVEIIKPENIESLTKELIAVRSNELIKFEPLIAKGSIVIGIKTNNIKTISSNDLVILKDTQNNLEIALLEILNTVIVCLDGKLTKKQHYDIEEFERHFPEIFKIVEIKTNAQ